MKNQLTVCAFAAAAAALAGAGLLPVFAQQPPSGRPPVEPAPAASPAQPAPAPAPATMPTTWPADARRTIYVPAMEGSGFGGPGFGRTFGQPLPPDVVQHVSVVLQVDSSTGDEPFNRGDAQSTASLLTSTALIDAALAATPLKLTPEQRRELVIVNASSAGGRYTRLDVALRKGERVELPPNAANELLAALSSRLKAAMEESAGAAREAQRAREGELARQMADAQKRMRDLRGRTRAFRDALGQLPNDYTGQDPQYAIRNIRQQAKQIESELTRSRARLAALEPGAGPLAAEWEQVVRLREQRVAALTKAEQKNPAEINEAEAQLAEAKAQLATVRRASDASDGTRSTRSSEVPQLKAQIAEAEARLKPYADALAKVEDPAFLETAEQMPELQQQEQRVRNEINEIQGRMDNFRRTSQFEPRFVVTVLDGEPDKR